MTNIKLVLYFVLCNQTRGENMTKQIVQDFVSDEVITLGAIGKMKLFTPMNGGLNVILYVDQQTERVSQSERADNASMAEFCLNELGFESVYNLEADGEESGLALADMKLEYDFHKKPYSITSAKIKEMQSLHALMQNSDIKMNLKRSFVDSKNKETIEMVSVEEFKKAVADYLRQNQK